VTTDTARTRLRTAEAGGPYADAPVTHGQGSWRDQDINRAEYNKLYMQTLPVRDIPLSFHCYRSQMSTAPNSQKTRSSHLSDADK
jgi:hypothetical protein